MTPFNNLRMELKEALDNLWSRISGLFSTVSGRVGDLEDAVDDLDGAMIKTISLNGVNVPKDAQGNVALQETDPTVPAWAKQAKAKTSDLTNDGDGSDNNSPFATQAYVQANGGKIDEVQVNGTALPIVDKAVNVPVPTLISQLTNDVGFTKDSIVEVDYGGQYISEIYPYLIDKIGNEEIRRFRANILRIGLLTNDEINVDVWGFIYRWDENNADDDIWFTMVCYEEYSGNACYYARVYSNERDYRREIVHVDTVFQFGSGGGGSGAVDTVTFNGVTYQPDANGNVSFGFAETDPTVPSWAKVASASAGANNLLSALPIWSATPTDDTYLIRKDTTGANSFGQVKFSTIFNYVKNKLETGGFDGNAATASGVIDAGNSARTITIRYGGADADATGWVPMYDSNGNLVPVTTDKLGAKLGVRRVLISASIGITASMSFDLSAYSSIECDVQFPYQRIHLSMPEKNVLYTISTLSSDSFTSSACYVSGIRIKFTDSGFEADYCGYKNISTGAWNNRFGNTGYRLRNIYGYV